MVPYSRLSRWRSGSSSVESLGTGMVACFVSTGVITDVASDSAATTERPSRTRSMRPSCTTAMISVPTSPGMSPRSKMDPPSLAHPRATETASRHHRAAACARRPLPDRRRRRIKMLSKSTTVAVHAGGPKQERPHTTPVTDTIDMGRVEADLTASEGGPEPTSYLPRPRSHRPPSQPDPSGVRRA